MILTNNNNNSSSTIQNNHHHENNNNENENEDELDELCRRIANLEVELKKRDEEIVILGFFDIFIFSRVFLLFVNFLFHS